MMSQASFAATLIGQFSRPFDENRVADALTALVVTARAITAGLSDPLDLADFDQVQRFTAAALRGLQRDLVDREARHVTLEAGHTAALLAHGLAYDRSVGDVVAALNIMAFAARQLTLALPDGSFDEPGHVLPISTSIGIAFMIGADESQLSDAIGIASSMTVATRPADRSSGPVNPGLVASCCANGALAAYLAFEGFSASPQSLEGPRGWRATLGGGEPVSDSRDPVPHPLGFLSGEAEVRVETNAAGMSLRALFPDLAMSFKKERAHD